MNLKLLATLILSMLVLSSAFAIADSGNHSGSEMNSAIPGNVSGTLYNLTFVAQGLTHLFKGSDNWTLWLDNSTILIPLYPTSDIVSKLVPAGSYYYQAGDYFQQLFDGGVSPTFYVNSNETIYVNFSTPYQVTFQEQGLSSSYVWGVNLSSSSAFPGASTSVYTSSNTASGGSAVTYYAISSQFVYNWFEIQNGLYNQLGSTYLSTGNYNMTVTVPMSQYSNVTFSESNLPSGTDWFVEQSAGPAMNNTFAHTTRSSLQIRAENGMNTFNAGYIINGSRFNLTQMQVNVGSQNTVSVGFPSLYSVKLTANNLPATADFNTWGVHVQSYYGQFYNSFTAYVTGPNNVVLLLPNSSYSMTPFIVLNNSTGGTAATYTVDYNSVSLAVSGSSIQDQINLSPLQKVTLNFVNFPSTNYLTVTSLKGNVLSYVNYETATTQVTLLAPNGTYEFTYGIEPHVIESNIPFEFTVNGAPSILNLQLSEVNFTSSYSSSGFSVTVSGSTIFYNGYFGVEAPTPGESINTYLANGTYYYEAYPLNAGPSNINLQTNGSFTVTGKSISIIAEFPATYYNTTIALSGPIPLENYSFSLQNQNDSVRTYYSHSGSGPGYIWLPAGTYFAEQFSGSYSSKYYVANTTEFTVSSAGPSTLDIVFSDKAYVMFTETGLPLGASWGLTFDGTKYTSTGQTILAGGYESQRLYFSINSVGNYYPDPASGSINPSDSYAINFTLPVTFTPLPLGAQKTPVSTLNLSNYMLGSDSQFHLHSNVSAGPITSDPMNGKTYLAYSSSSFDGSSGILVVNSSNYAMVANIQIMTSAEPLYSVLDQSNGILYTSFYTFVGNHPSSYIASLNTNTNAVTVTPLNITGLYSLLVDTQNGMIYAAGQNAVYELDPATLEVLSTIQMNNSYDQNFYLQGVLDIVYSEHTGLIYATGYLPNGLVVIDPSTNSITGTYYFTTQINYDSYFGGSVLDTGNGVLYFGVQTYNYTTGEYILTLEVFDTLTDAFQQGLVIGQGYAFSLLYDPANGNVYIPLQMAYSSNALADLSLGQLDIYNPTTGLLTNYTELGMNVYQAAIDASNGNIMISSLGMGSVAIINNGNYGYISGSVSNSSAIVTINGVTVPVINGHFGAAVLPGDYYVSAFLNGFAPEVQSVTVSAFTTSAVGINFNQAVTTYMVYGTVSPADATVTLNGYSASVNASGKYEIMVPAGEYTVSAFLNGYFPSSQTVDVNGNTELNLTLSREPAPTSVVNENNVSVQGFNVSIMAFATGSNGTVTLVFNSTGNGILTVEVPFSDLKNANLSDMIHSRVYINGVQYSNFTITITSNYTVILKVSGLNADPQLIWVYNPSVTITQPNGASLMTYLPYIIAAAVVVIAAGVGLILYRKKK